MRLVAIGLAAGFFGALFGVGGGIVIVPGLLLLAHLAERVALATSLAAVGLVALVGSVVYATQGEVEPGAAAIVGVPAAAGAILGARLQQRLARRTLALAFSALLALLAARLLIG